MPISSTWYKLIRLGAIPSWWLVMIALLIVAGLLDDVAGGDGLAFIALLVGIGAPVTAGCFGMMKFAKDMTNLIENQRKLMHNSDEDFFNQ